jgi:BON domain-containing protein
MTLSSIKNLFRIIVPLILTAGCVDSQRAPYAYTPAYTTTPSTVTVSPTSEYGTERVYAVPSETVVTTPPSVVYETSRQPVVPAAPVVTSQAPFIITEPPRNAAVGTTSSTDLVLAGELRRMIVDDDELLAAARNVRISIYNGRVTLTGTTVTRAERERLHAAVESVPGVYNVDDRVRPTLNR